MLPVSLSPYCAHHCAGAHTATSTGSFSLYLPAPSLAQALCSAPTSAAKGLPRSSPGRTAVPWGFPAGRAEVGCSHPGPPMPAPE